MFIILPKKIDGLADLEAKLAVNNEILNKIDELIYEESVTVYMPKFKIETTLKMKDILVKLGIKDLFDESLADLSGISDRKDNLHCSQVYHKCFIEVNEEGSEAAAATGSTF